MEADDLSPPRRTSHHEPRPASNYHVFLSFGLSALVTVVGFAATWGRTEQWRETMDGRMKAQELRSETLAVQIAQHEATIQVVRAQYEHIGKQLDRIEEKFDRPGQGNPR